MFMTMKYQCLSFIYVLCFSMSRFWVLGHLLLPLPFCFVSLFFLLVTVNGLVFPGSLDEAMMSGALMFNSLYHHEIYTTIPFLDFYFCASSPTPLCLYSLSRYLFKLKKVVTLFVCFFNVKTLD